MYVPVAEVLINIALVSLVMCVLIMVFGWLLDKIGVKNLERAAGILLLLALLVGMSSAAAGALLSLSK